MFKLFCADDPKTWEQAGFYVFENKSIYLGKFEISFVNFYSDLDLKKNNITDISMGLYRHKGLPGWSWEENSSPPPLKGRNTSKKSLSLIEFDLVGVYLAKELIPPRPVHIAPHPNGAIGLDHIVIRSNNLYDIEQSFQEAKIPLRLKIAGYSS